MWTTLNFGGSSKTEKQAEDICKGTPDIEFEQDWSVGLGAMLGEEQKIKKNIILVTRIFSGKADSAILLRLECAINPQNLMKIFGAIFEKMTINIFFLYELPLILGVDGEKKWAKNICRVTLDIEWERDWPFGLGATLGDGQKVKNYFSIFRHFSGKSRYCHIVKCKGIPISGHQGPWGMWTQGSTYSQPRH